MSALGSPARFLLACIVASMVHLASGIALAVPDRGRDVTAETPTAPKSLTTITGEAGMTVPLGGDDVVLASSSTLQGPAWLRMASDGTYFVGVVDGGDAHVYRSLDKGETWTLWSSYSDPAGIILWLPCFALAEGNANRVFVAYRASVGGESVIRVAYADIAAAVPTWTVTTGLGAPGVDIGTNLRIDIATDAAYYPDYYVYLVAQGNDGGGEDIWFARSVNQGTSFEAGYPIAESGVGGFTTRRDPHITCGANDFVQVTYASETVGSEVAHTRRAATWANGGLAAWQAEQTLATATGAAGLAPAAIGTSLGTSNVYVTLVTFVDPGLPRLCFSTDDGATWPAANRTNPADYPTGSAMAPVLLSGGQLAMVGVSVNFVGSERYMDIVESRSTLADPTTWSAHQAYSHHPWTDGGSYSSISGAIADPAFGDRLAVAWVQTTVPDKILRFDAEWRRDPGYPNTDIGFPLALGSGYSPPAIAEIDGDPESEIVVGSRNGNIHVFNHDGTIVPGWPVNIGSLPYDAPVAVGDLSGGGEPTIVAGDEHGMVYAFGPDGTPRPGWPVSLGEDAPVFVSIGALGPPYPRYVVAVGGHEIHAYNYNGTDVSPAWGTFTDPVSRPAAIGDTDGDGRAEIVTLHGAWLHVQSLDQGSSEVFRNFPGEIFSDAPTLADVDFDGTLEIACPTLAGKLYLLDHDGSDFSAAWPITVTSGSPLTGVAFGQILGTFEPELVFSERSTGLVHIRYINGNEQSGYPKASGSTNLYMPPMLTPVNISVSNVNVGTTSAGQGTAQSWRNLGYIPDGWPRNLPGPVEETLAAGDIDLDGRNELVVRGLDFLTVLDVGVSPMTVGDRHWPMYGYDAQRTGCLDCVEELSPVADLPTAPRLGLSAHPNPFNPSTMIAYTVPQDGPVSLKIYDLSGKCVATLVDGESRSAGRHQESFRALKAASGVYLARLSTAQGHATEKIVLLK